LAGRFEAVAAVRTEPEDVHVGAQSTGVADIPMCLLH
jgi:hypothetical protein